MSTTTFKDFFVQKIFLCENDFFRPKNFMVGIAGSFTFEFWSKFRFLFAFSPKTDISVVHLVYPEKRPDGPTTYNRGYPS